MEDLSIAQKGLSPELDYKLEEQHSIEQKGEASDACPHSQTHMFLKPATPGRDFWPRRAR